MKGHLVTALSGVAVLMVASIAVAASPPPPTPAPTPGSMATQPAPFEIQARVLTVGKGWMEVRVLKVAHGLSLRAQSKLRVRQTARTRFVKTGRTASVKDLRTGETVAISGTVAKRGTALTYQVDSVTIME